MKLRSNRTIRHAAHYLYGPGGHDLEEWVVESPCVPWEFRQHDELGIPREAQYSYGFRDGDVQCWVFLLKRPLSDGTCNRCAP